MATYIYDEALTAKFRAWTKDTQISLTSPDETRRLFEIMSDKSNDSPIKLPFIGLKRNPGYQIDLYGKKPITFDGFLKEASYENGKKICAIPVTLSYQADVYARYFTEADEIMRNLLFNIINYPKLEIEIKYRDLDYIHCANILPGREITDSSSSDNIHFSYGQFTKLSYSFSIDDAYLWDVRLKTNKYIEVGSNDGQLHIIDKSTNEDIVETYL